MFSTCDCFVTIKPCTFNLGVDGSWKKVCFHTGDGVHEVNGLPCCI